VRQRNALTIQNFPFTIQACHLRRSCLMSRFCQLCLALCLFAFANACAAGTISVLFVGNSLTQVNDLPGVFKHFAAESLLHSEIEVRSITPGGATLADHWKRGQALSNLRTYRPNFLILQGQSTEPLSAPDSFNLYARRFKSEADQVGSTTILFSTWARPATDSYYHDASSGGSPTEMQIRLNSAYAEVANNIGAICAPIGVAWQRAEKIAPNIQLLDGSQHPSPAGTYLATAILFRTIFNASAVCSTYCGSLPNTIAHSLQRIADQVPIYPAH